MPSVAKRRGEPFSTAFPLGSWAWTGWKVGAKFVATRTALIALPLGILLLAPSPATAGPFRHFFKRIGRAFAEPARKPSTHRSSQQYRNTNKSSGPSVSTAVHAPPSHGNTRIAKRSAAMHGGKVDTPYGTPVPGKKGLVTSPFAPDSGYIDVRGVPPGTAVKDPYSGKTFLTP